jgi:aldehyde dehydrogenase (NAD+)
MLARKIAPAIAAGNTVVLKPAERTPLTALLFAGLCQKIGLPAGVVNIVTGTDETGTALVAHRGVDKIAFTGPTETGKAIREATANTGKDLSLELGDKPPFIVFEDADLDSAVEGLIETVRSGRGQASRGGTRLLLQESIEETFIDKLKARMNKLRLGDPLDKSTDIGAYPDPAQLARLRDLLEQGRQEGGDYFEAEIIAPERGAFVKPVLVAKVSPVHLLVREETTGPVLVEMSYRTPEEAVALANNSRYGMTASIWSENVNLAFDIAPKLKSGTVWINSADLYDAASGFGGLRESGYGREGGKEGMSAYLKHAFETRLKTASAGAVPAETGTQPESSDISGFDHTARLYIGGRQVSGESGRFHPVLSPDGTGLDAVPDGGSGDIGKAVAAARQALDWAASPGAVRSRVLYFLGENLNARKSEFIARIRAMTGVATIDAEREVAASIERLFAFAGWADKHDGAVQDVPVRAIAMAMNEPLGVIGIAAPEENPLLGAISLLAPAIAAGNTAVLIPSRKYPLSMTDFYPVLESSEVPDGVVNIVTGDSTALGKVLAGHDGIDGLWFCGSAEASADMERASVHNLKRVWTTHGRVFDWFDKVALESDYFLQKATLVKNIWIPYGV